MISPTLSRLRPLAVLVLAALTLALAAFVLSDDADAKPKGGATSTKTFTGKSPGVKGAAMTLKTNRDSKGKAQVVSFTVTARATCSADGKSATLPMKWTFDRYPLGFGKNPKGEVGFELFEEEGNGEVGEEEFSAFGRAENGHLRVTVSRSYPEPESRVPGFADTSTLVNCEFKGRFVFDLR